jgi:hypothetical protein
MSLGVRLKQLELILSSRKIMLGHSVGTDDVIRHMGFDPVAVRESAHTTGKSVVEIICEKIGMEPREFQRMLKEKINLGR